MPASLRAPTPSTSSSPFEDDFPLPQSDSFSIPFHSKSGAWPANPVNPGAPRAASTPPDLIDETRLRKYVGKGIPHDSSALALVGRPQERRELSKKRSQYYGGVFAYREPNNTARDRIGRDSMVIAELKTNVPSEHTLLTELSFQLSQRYQRPESSIFVFAEHSASLLLDGTHDPAYLLTITALPSQIAPTMNKRNAGLIQAFLQESLDISAKRGVIRFTSIAEENLATNGLTTLGEIEQLERSSCEEGGATMRSLSRNNGRKKKSMNLITTNLPPRSKTPLPITPPSSSQEGSMESKMDSKMDTVRRVKKRKSIMAFFGR